MDFFSETSDKMINTIKQELFKVAGGAPIVGRDHPVLQEMMDLPAPVQNGIACQCMHPSPARTATARHARMRTCLCTLRADHVLSVQASTFSLRPSKTSKMTELCASETLIGSARKICTLFLVRSPPPPQRPSCLQHIAYRELYRMLTYDIVC